MQAFIDTAASRETSREIMEAIAQIARNESEAVRIWEAPTDSELRAVYAIVTGAGSRDPQDYVWGADGDMWAADL